MLAQNYLALSHPERKRFQAFTDSWRSFTLSAEDHPYATIMNQLMSAINQDHELQKVFNIHIDHRKQEARGDAGPYKSLSDLVS